MSLANITKSYKLPYNIIYVVLDKNKTKNFKNNVLYINVPAYNIIALRRDSSSSGEIWNIPTGRGRYALFQVLYIISYTYYVYTYKYYTPIYLYFFFGIFPLCNYGHKNDLERPKRPRDRKPSEQPPPPPPPHHDAPKYNTHIYSIVRSTLYTRARRPDIPVLFAAEEKR